MKRKDVRGWIRWLDALIVAPTALADTDAVGDKETDMYKEEINETLAEIRQMYEVVDNKIISPGKFEGEPIWVPYFYREHPCDNAFEGDTELLAFEVTASEKQLFRDLEDKEMVVLYEDDQGFVHKRFMTSSEWEMLAEDLLSPAETADEICAPSP